MLKKRTEFVDVRNKGSSLKSKFFIVNYSSNFDAGVMFGFTVSKKIGNAVTRNYLKRILRSIVRGNIILPSNNISIEIIPKKNSEKIKYSSLEKDLTNLLKNLKI